MEAIELRNLYGWLVRLRVLLGRMAHPALDGGGNGYGNNFGWNYKKSILDYRYGEGNKTFWPFDLN